ncbi:MAG: ATPase, T2SS/T4P/T4SS family [Deltaproteobacteria bacterium]|nr:ATPase, T2SS/T4P/T4SS family [Deltaproteobacteria bacterium]
MAISLTLTIETPGASADTFEIPADDEITIGRDEGCTVVLASPEISRRHLTFVAGPMDVEVRDSSANGTRIGDARLHRTAARIPFGTPMFVGPYIVRVEGVTGMPMPVQQMHPQHMQHPHAQPPPRPPMNAQATRAPNAGPVAVPPMRPAGVQAQMQGSPTGQAGGALEPGRAPGGPTAAVTVLTRKKIHRMLLENLDLASVDRTKMDDKVMRPRVRDALTRIIAQLQGEIPSGTDLDALKQEMADEALGLGPLEAFLANPTISEIMVVDSQTIFIEQKGRLVRADARFTDDEAVRAVIERIVTPLGRRIDESTPLVDARLKDGSRVNAVIRPLALKGSCITIRKFSKSPLRLPDLVRFGGMTEQMGKFLLRSVKAKKNIVISGGTGSGKTTLLNVLSAAIPEEERVVTIEDAAELQLSQLHVVSLESKPPNMEGKGEYSIRDLVKNALRMRPDRIVIGECRGGEALDMLQAMNTGHDGSLTTTHANSPKEAIARLETLSLMSGLDLPSRAIREQIANSVHLVVQQSRFNDGSRRVTNITEVCGIEDNGEIVLREIFKFVRTGTSAEGKVVGEFRATGYLPSFLDTFIAYGLIEGSDYL